MRLLTLTAVSLFIASAAMACAGEDDPAATVTVTRLANHGCVAHRDRHIVPRADRDRLVDRHGYRNRVAHVDP